MISSKPDILGRLESALGEPERRRDLVPLSTDSFEVFMGDASSPIDFSLFKDEHLLSRRRRKCAANEDPSEKPEEKENGATMEKGDRKFPDPRISWGY